MKTICEQLGGLLEIEISTQEINSYYWLENVQNNPVKIDLISNIKKSEILKNSFRLKGSGLNIVQDLTVQQRAETKKLRTYLKKARENPNNRSFIKGNKLHINKQIYTLDELENSAEKSFGRPISAPSTPTVRNIDKEFERLISEAKTGSDKLKNKEEIETVLPTTSLAAEASPKQETPKVSKEFIKKRKPSDTSLGQNNKPRLRSTKQ